MTYPWQKISRGIGYQTDRRWLDVQSRRHEAVGFGIGYDYKRHRLLVLFLFHRITIGILRVNHAGGSLRRLLTPWSHPAEMQRSYKARIKAHRTIGRHLKVIAAEEEA